MKYLIAILLPEPIRQEIRRLQLKHKSARWNIRVEPHITLIFRGDILGSERDLIARLADVAEGCEPFEIRLRGIGVFDKKLKVVFAQVEPTHELLRLQSDLAKHIHLQFIGDDNYSEPSEYHPHVTISNRLSENETQSITRDLDSHPINYAFRCQEFTLLRRGPKDFNWIEVETFRLGKTAAG